MGSAPATVGTLATRQISFGDGIATLEFNHTNPGYVFTPDPASTGTGTKGIVLDHAVRPMDGKHSCAVCFQRYRGIGFCENSRKLYQVFERAADGPFRLS